LRATRDAVARQETRREEFKALGKYQPQSDRPIPPPSSKR
jgi:hypothetical protein